MTGPSVPAGLLGPSRQERLRLFETGLRALREAPFEVLRARGVVRDGEAFAMLRADGPRWFLDAADDVAVAFFLLIEEAHAASEAALAAVPDPRRS